MTRSRLAAIAALSVPALLVTTTGGEAAKRDYSARTACKTEHTMTRDFARLRTKVRRDVADDARAAVLVPVKGATVITKLTDLNLADGNNVVPPAKDRATTNKRGVARTVHEFNNFSTYRVNVVVKVAGDVVERYKFEFVVADRTNGRCEAPASSPA